MKKLVLNTLIVVGGFVAGVQSLQAQSLNSRNVYVDVHPAGIPVGSVGIDLSTDVNEYWTAGVSATHSEIYHNDEGFNGSSVGLIGSYFFNTPLLDSPYIKSSVSRSQFKVNARDEESGQVDNSLVTYGGATVLAGYHWAWSNGVNVNAGLGGSYNRFNSNAKKGIEIKKGRYFKASLPKDNLSGITPSAELSVGVTI